uniref:Uncharacterized protein n=1 Tax=Anguilla anguilla TaxID=7936 RepID=A0A0E9PVU1_ANGAN
MCLRCVRSSQSHLSCDSDLRFSEKHLCKSALFLIYFLQSLKTEVEMGGRVMCVMCCTVTQRPNQENGTCLILGGH